MENKYFGIDLNFYKNVDDEQIEKLKRMYFDAFLEVPPIFKTLGDAHPIMLYLMDKSLINGEPFSQEDIEELMDIFGVKIDLVEE